MYLCPQIQAVTYARFFFYWTHIMFIKCDLDFDMRKKLQLVTKNINVVKQQ